MNSTPTLEELQHHWRARARYQILLSRPECRGNNESTQHANLEWSTAQATAARLNDQVAAAMPLASTWIKPLYFVDLQTVDGQPAQAHREARRQDRGRR